MCGRPRGLSRRTPLVPRARQETIDVWRRVVVLGRTKVRATGSETVRKPGVT